MEAQLKRAGTPGPGVIGIDEIAIRKGHTYRIVVSDLLRGRPIWFGGKDRSEASMREFYAWLGEKKSARIRLAVMDMWKPFRLATAAHAPQAAILFDKFHVIWARPWITFARANMGGLRAATGATSRGRNTHCCRARRTSRSTARRH
jgi:transposase